MAVPQAPAEVPASFNRRNSLTHHVPSRRPSRRRNPITPGSTSSEKPSLESEKAPSMAQKSPSLTEKVPCVAQKAPSMPQKVPCMPRKASAMAEKAVRMGKKVPCMTQKAPSLPQKAACMAQKAASLPKKTPRGGVASGTVGTLRCRGGIRPAAGPACGSWRSARPVRGAGLPAPGCGRPP